MMRPLVLLSLALSAAPAAAQTCHVLRGGAETVIDAVVLDDTPTPRRAVTVIAPDGRITCTGPACRATTPSPTTIDCAADSLSPGYINPHDHIDFTGDPPAPDTGERYVHRHEWRIGLDGHKKVVENPNEDPEIVAWGELRMLISGVTSIVGGGMAPGLIRNLDFPAGLEGLPIRPVTFQVFPLDDAPGIMRTADCNYGHHPSTRGDVAGSQAFLAHVAEGTGEAARNEFRCLSNPAYDTTPQADGGGTAHNLMMPNMTVLHGVGLTPDDLARLRASGVTLVWSPRSNLSLYGRTLDVLTAERLGIPIGLGTDWLPSGSMNMSREFACARRYSDDHLNHALSDRTLWHMATIGSATATHTQGLLGRIAPGTEADLVLYRPTAGGPYAAATHDEPGDIDLVMRGGRILYASADIAENLALPGCEPLMVQGQPKRLCIRRDQPFSFAMLQQDMTEQHIYPLAFDHAPRDEPPCDTLEDHHSRHAAL